MHVVGVTHYLDHPKVNGVRTFLPRLAVALAKADLHLGTDRLGDRLVLERPKHLIRKYVFCQCKGRFICGILQENIFPYETF